MSDEVKLLAGVHPEVAHLSWMVGSWRGYGVAEFADRPQLAFEQEVEFASTGEPFLEYSLKSWWINQDKERVEDFRFESGIWAGQENNLVAVKLTEHDGLDTWLGHAQVAEIVNAVITRAGMKLYVPNPENPTENLAHLGVRSYGLFQEKLLIVHEMGPEDESTTDKISIMMERA